MACGLSEACPQTDWGGLTALINRARADRLLIGKFYVGQNRERLAKGEGSVQGGSVIFSASYQGVYTRSLRSEESS